MSIKKTLLKSWSKPNVLTTVLKPISRLYDGVFSVRKRAYNKGLLKSYRAPLPVIVIGNLTVGGTGKTPLVIHLVQQLESLGLNPGVISRGYSGEADSYPLEVTASTPVEQSGDEPALIVKRTSAPMAVGPNRQDSIELLIERHSIDIIVSDDGLQHLALERDVEVCLLDDTVELENENLLPAGPYREPLSRLMTVDFIVRHGGVVGNAENQFSMHLEPRPPVALLASKTKVFPKSETIEAVAGIGQPQRFFDTCRSMNLTINEHSFADHYQFTRDDLEFGGRTVLMTEKDAVKCSSFATGNHWFLPVDAVLTEGFAESIAKTAQHNFKLNRASLIHGN